MPAQPVLHPTDETLVAYGLGEIGNATAISRHLEACPGCRRRVAEFAADSSVVGPHSSHPRTGRAIHPAVPAALPPELAQSPQYTDIRELGRGRMGVVYVAKNTLMDRLEVLKVLNRSLIERSGAVERFLREIRAAAKLQHPNVVGAYSALQLGDLLVFAMEYVPGHDLSALVKARGPLPVPNACYYAYHTALGLQHAHEKGMVHRDIKPGNLILSRAAGKSVVKILDFGLAKATSEKRVDGGLTGDGKMMGTPDYMAPEQAMDAAAANIRADVYSLGCTLYFMLSGRPPFFGRSLFELLQSHQTSHAEALNMVRPEVPVELAGVVAAMMAKEPGARFQTPGDAAKALAPFVKAGVTRSQASDASHRSGETAIPDTARAVVEVAPVARPDSRPVWQTISEALDIPPHQLRSPATPTRKRDWSPGVLVAGVFAAVLVAWVGGVFKAKARPGTIVVENVPADAEVEVDGQTVASSRSSDAVTVSAVTAGSHKVRVTQKGTEVWASEVTVGGTPVLVKAETRTAAAANALKTNHRLPESTPTFGLVIQPTKNTLIGHTAKVRFLAFTPDGSRLVSASNSNHDVVKDNTRFNTAGDDNTVRVWSLDPLLQVRKFDVNQGSRYGPQGLAVSSDGRLVAVTASWEWGRGYTDSTIQIYDVHTSTKKVNIKVGGDRAMRSIAFSADDQVIYASRSGSNWFHEYSASTGSEIGTPGQPPSSGETPLATLYTTGGESVIIPGWDGVIRLWDRGTGRRIRALHGHEKLPTALAVSKDGSLLLSAAEDYSVRLWNTRLPTRGTASPGSDVKEALAVTGLDAIVRSVALNADLKWFVTGGDDGVVRLRDATTGKEIKTLNGLSSPVLSVAISPNDKLIAAGSENGAVALWGIK